MKHLLLAACFAITAVAAKAEMVIQELTSPAGTSAWLYEEHSLPFVALEIRFMGGTVLDEPGKRGAINLMTGLIEEGAADMDARTFQAKREGLAASFTFDSYDDGLSVSARFLTENRDESVRLLTQALNEPRFDQDAIDRVRSQVLSGIASDEKSPNRLAGDALYGMAFGDHPYATDQSGTVESVNALTRDDIVNAHRNALVRSRAYVSAVGDITAEELGLIIDQLLGGLPEDGPALPEHVDFDVTGGITVVPFDTPQSVALFGHSGMKRDDEDFFAAYVLNTILGGNGPQSILMDEVREKRGLTYGVYTYLVPKDYAEFMLGSVASGNDRIKDAITVIQDNWSRIATEGVTAEQLEIAKTYLVGEYPLRFDGNGEIADIMVGMQVEGLPAEYVSERNDYIEAVTLEDVNRVAAELLQPDNLRFVVVGRPEGIESTD